MISAIGDLALLSAGVFLCVGMLWKAAGSSENRLWNVLGAVGWALVAATTFTDGFIQIGIALVALVVFLVIVAFQRMDPDELPRMT